MNPICTLATGIYTGLKNQLRENTYRCEAITIFQLKLQPSFSRYLCCVCWFYTWGIFSLMSTSYDRFVRYFFNGNFIYSQSFWQKCAERKPPNKYFFIFRFIRDIWPGVGTVAWTSNKPNTTYEIIIYYYYLQNLIKGKYCKAEQFSSNQYFFY